MKPSRISKPDWNNLTFHEIIKHWDEHVEPINKLIDGAVEVRGNVDQFSMSEWRCARGNAYSDRTHKAYLIGIEEIKPETADSILIGLAKLNDEIFGENKVFTKEDHELLKQVSDRAKKYLGEK